MARRSRFHRHAASASASMPLAATGHSLAGFASETTAPGEYDRLSAEVTKSQAYLDRVRQGENNAALGGGRGVAL